MHTNEIPVEANHQEEEAHFFWVLSDFQELVHIYGVEKVMKEMNEDTFWAIEKYLGR